MSYNPTLRTTKGSPLTYTELDNNFSGVVQEFTDNANALAAPNSTVPFAGTTAGEVVDKLSKTVIQVSHLKALPVSGLVDNQQYSVAGFYADSNIGGGVFVYDANKSKADHDGINVITPEAITTWNGTQGNLTALLNWTGSGNGCFVKQDADSYAKNTVYCGMPKTTIHPFEDFDRPEGTLLNNIKTTSGHILTASAVGASTLRIKDGGAFADANTYIGLTSDELVTKVSGVFSYAPDGIGQVVIMFNGGVTANSLNKLVHLEVSPTNTVLKLTVTEPTDLSDWQGTITERHGHSNIPFYLRPVERNFTPYHVSMEYFEKGSALEDLLVVYMPDGRILEHVGDVRLREIMQTCKYGTWQLTGSAGRWYNMSLGETRAQYPNKSVRVATEQVIAPLLNKTRFWKKNQISSLYPSKVGWYKIIEEVRESGAYSSIVGTVKIYGRDNSGRQTYAEVFLNSFSSTKNEITVIKNGFGSFGGILLPRVRLSYESANGGRQFEILVDRYVNQLDYFAIEFEGMGNLLETPTVDSTPFAVSREQSTLDLSKQVREEPAISTKTFVSGVDFENQLLLNHYSSNVTFYVDDTKALPNDVFTFSREISRANSAVIKNLSDDSDIVTLSAGESARLFVSGSKFKLFSKSSS